MIFDSDPIPKSEIKLLSQSLFSWILIANMERQLHLNTSYISFNPCFRGSCSRISILGIRIVEGEESILVLVDLARESCNDCTEKDQKVRFNPCFSGSCSRISNLTMLPWTRKKVSILVLVDLARESWIHVTTVNVTMVSILVLVDLAPRIRSTKVQ